MLLANNDFKSKANTKLLLVALDIAAVPVTNPVVGDIIKVIEKANCLKIQ